MKRVITIGLLILLAVGFALGRHLLNKSGKTLANSVNIRREEFLAADRQISRAQDLIRRSPSRPDGYNLLASAYIQKARETGDFSLNAKAEAAINKSLEVAPDNFDGHNLRATVLLNYHRFREALDAAEHAKTLQPYSSLSYEAITDSLVELGRYSQAVQAAQTMVDIRPDTPAYSRISYIRCLYGDTQGAIKVMTDAVTSSGSPENAAWCRIHLGMELIGVGRLKDAEHEFDLALQDLPGFYLALAAKGRIRAMAGDSDSAIQFYKQSKDLVPLPDTIMALGDLYASVGRMDDARREYEFLATIERAALDPLLYKRQMALFWADHDQRLDDAVRTARDERTTRSDIYTNDLLAWCLFKSNNATEAADYMKQALSLGTRDARLCYHAGMIYEALGDKQQAITYLKESLMYRVSFDNSISSFGPLQEESVRHALRRLEASALVPRAASQDGSEEAGIFFLLL